MTSSLEDEIQRVLANMDNEQNSQEQDVPVEPAETVHIHYFPDAILIVKEDTDNAQPDNAVETTLAQTKQPPVFIAYSVVLFYLLLIFSCIAFQVYEILYAPIATITIIPKSQQVSLNGTLQLGRVLQPITISQSQTIATTDKEHQDAKQASGYITLYNGQLNSIFVPSGLLLTGNDGVQIVTDHDASIPAANLPQVGQVTVSAHAINSGSRGNIAAYDINEACCATAIKAVNTSSFTNGQDERNFQTVAKNDLTNIAGTLKPEVTQSMRGALQGQVQPPEQLFILPCTPVQTSDHQPGQEATQVKVTVSETCGAVAYNSQELEQKAADLLNRQAETKPGTGYSLFGTVRVVLNQATVTRTTPPLVFLSFRASGTWIYALSHTAQQQIKQLIAGKTKQEALHILASLPGVEQAAIRWGDDTRLPKDSSSIHFVMLINSV